MTDRIVWTDEFSVGHLEMDRDHQKLIEIFNRLIVLVESEDGVSINTRHDIVAGLIDFVYLFREHYLREENMLASICYPGLDLQQKSHHGVEEGLVGLMSRGVSKSEQQQRAISILREWLLKHVLLEDMAYKPYVEGMSKVA